MVIITKLFLVGPSLVFIVCQFKISFQIRQNIPELEIPNLLYWPKFHAVHKFVISSVWTFEHLHGNIHSDWENASIRRKQTWPTSDFFTKQSSKTMFYFCSQFGSMSQQLCRLAASFGIKYVWTLQKQSRISIMFRLWPKEHQNNCDGGQPLEGAVRIRHVVFSEWYLDRKYMLTSY